MDQVDDQNAEVEGLRRVLTRLALTDDDKLEGILEKLLPLVIGRLDGAAAALQKSVLDILAHVNLRLQAAPSVSLPLEALVRLFTTSSSPLVRNFALVYVERGMERATAEARFAQVGPLLAGVATRPPPQQAILLRMAARALEHLATPTNAFAMGNSEEFAAKHSFLQNDADRRIFLDFSLRLALYTPPTIRGPTSALAAAQAARYLSVQGNEDPTLAAPTGPPPGLSSADVSKIEGKTGVDAASLPRQKLGILNFTSFAGVNPTEVLPLYLAAACDPGDAVSRRGDELLKKRCAVDAHRPVVDLERHEVINPLFTLFLGTLDDESLASGYRRAPASLGMKGRLLTLFCKSVAAANAAPAAMTAVTECLFSAGSTPRLQQQGMEFAVWMLKHAAPEVLAPAAPALLEGCLSLLDSSPISFDSQTLALRGFVYQALGHLAQRQPSALRGRMDLAARCFHGLASEPAGVRAAVQEATSCLAAAFEERDASTDTEILRLLQTSMEHTQETVRGAAVQWASRLFSFDHVEARYLCILGTADTRMQIAQAAAEGLNPEKFAARSKGENSGGGGGKGGQQYPSLGPMLQYFGGRHPAVKSHMEETQRLAMPHKAYLSAISFLEKCRLKSEGNRGNEGGDVAFSEQIAEYLVFLENALVRESPAELHSAALHAFLAVSAAHRPEFVAAYCHRPALFERLLGHVDPNSRDAAARLLGTLCSGMSPEQAQRMVEHAVVTVRSSSGGGGGAGTDSGGGKKVKFEDTDGAIAAVGYFASQLVTGSPAVPHEVLQDALRALREKLDNSTADANLRATAAVALGCAALPLAASTDTWALRALPEAAGIAVSMISLLKEKEKEAKVAKRAAQGLGFLAHGHRTADVMDPIIESLLALRTSKLEEVLLASGEALAMVFGGVGFTAEDVLRTPFSSLSEWSQASSSQGKANNNKERPSSDAMEVDREENRDSLEDSPSVYEKEAQARILAAVLDECVGHSRPEVRCAGATWLVSLLLFCGKTAAVCGELPRAQTALCALLGDDSEMTQEMASRGLAACYELAGDAVRGALVDSLVGTLSGTGGGRKRRAGDVTGDTQVFEPGALGSVPGGGGSGNGNGGGGGGGGGSSGSGSGGGLSTYKEICALATDLGQPDLVYRFMQLANHQAAVNASRGAAFGFASVAKLAGDALSPHVGKLVPRLYRSLYDPQPKVRDAMRHIWAALVDDPRTELTKHFDAVATSLAAEMTGNQWRVREAAALAAADLVQGRRWDELHAHFRPLWEAALRVMDDIKESVRLAGMALVRCMRGLTLRLADPELTAAADSKEAVAVSLPLLLEKALPSRVPEVQALAVDTTARLVKAAGPEVVRPHLKILVPAMLESLSGLEDSRLNYVEQHAQRLGVDSGRLESLRVTAAQGSPIGDTLDVCARCLDAESLVELAPALAGLIRRGVGLNTRAGAGKFVSQVARRLGADAAPAAPPLMRALQEACRAERSSVVRRAYASANAVLAKHASQSRVDAAVTSWLATAQDADADTDARATAGIMLRALSREASDVFAAHAATVAPVAYLAALDPDSTVSEVWGDIWEESTTSLGAGLRIHMRTVMDLALGGLRSAQWGRKRAGAAAVTKVSESAGDAMGPHAAEVATALLAELPGRLWEGKEGVLTALGAIVSAGAEPIKAAADALPAKIVAALLEAAAKKKTAYRKEALVQLKKVLEAWKEDDFVSSVAPTLQDWCTEFATSKNKGATTTTATASAGGSNGTSDKNKTEDTSAAATPPIAEIMGCLGAAWAAGSLSNNSHPGSSLVTTPPGAWTSQGAASVGQVLAAASGKISDQTAAIEAGTSLIKRSTELKITLDYKVEAWQGLMTAATRVAEEGKSATLREQALELVGLMLAQAWPGMGEEGREKWRAPVASIAEVDKLPVLRSRAATILMELP